jgi:hypothetical protein
MEMDLLLAQDATMTTASMAAEIKDPVIKRTARQEHARDRTAS